MNRLENMSQRLAATRAVQLRALSTALRSKPISYSGSPATKFDRLRSIRTCYFPSSCRRLVHSSGVLSKDAKAKENAGKADLEDGGDEDDDACPNWQNPLHHNNPDYENVFDEDFEPGKSPEATPLPPFDDGTGRMSVVAPPHIDELADEIVNMSMLEMNELVNRIGEHFGIVDDGTDVGDVVGVEGEDDKGAEEEAAAEERTAFDLKLAGFDAKAKIKVIKEVRAITTLGLKEAKEMVEGAPKVIKKDIKMEEAEELKAKLEAVGATVEIV